MSSHSHNKKYLVLLAIPVEAEQLDSIWDVTHHVQLPCIQQASFVGVVDPGQIETVNVVKDRFSPITGEMPLKTALSDHGKQVKKPVRRRQYDEH